MYTIDQIMDRVDAEGFEYAILTYISPDSIEDKALAEQIKRVHVLMREIRAYLEEKAPDRWE